MTALTIIKPVFIVMVDGQGRERRVTGGGGGGAGLVQLQRRLEEALDDVTVFNTEVKLMENVVCYSQKSWLFIIQLR